MRDDSPALGCFRCLPWGNCEGVHSDDFEDQLQSALVRRPAIEQAKGVLVGTRCASPEEAFDELRDVSRRHDLGVGDVAAALVAVAAGRTPENPLLRKVVWQEWNELFPNC